MEELGLSIFLLLSLLWFAPALAHLALCLLAAALAYKYWRYRFGGLAERWKRKGVAQPGWSAFPLGNSAASDFWAKIGWEDPVEVVRRQYDQVAPASVAVERPKVFGTYDFGLSATPILTVREPAIARGILVADTPAHFDRRPWFPIDDARDTRTDRIWKKMLFNLRGREGRKMRSALRAVFCPTNLRSLSSTLGELAERMSDEVEERAEDGRHLDLADVFARFVVDCVAHCAFGADAEPYRKDKQTEFHHLYKTIRSRSDIDAVRLWSSRLLPSPVASVLGFSVFRPLDTGYYADLLEANLRRRRGGEGGRSRRRLLALEGAAGDAGPGDQMEEEGNMLDVLLVDSSVRKEMLRRDLPSEDEFDKDAEPREGSDGEEEDLDDESVAATAISFVLHGIEETAATAARAAFEVHRHPKVQRRLLEELDSAVSRTGGALDYDALDSMEYMSAVILETLRMYPVVSHLSRTCESDYSLPGCGRRGGDLLVEKGTEVQIPVSGVCADPDWHRRPERFDPSRFMRGGKKKPLWKEEEKEEERLRFVGFGRGPRGCPGRRFAMLEAKAGLAALLARFHLEKSPTLTSESVEKVGRRDQPLWVKAVAREDKKKKGKSKSLKKEEAYVAPPPLEMEKEEDENSG